MAAERAGRARPAPLALPLQPQLPMTGEPAGDEVRRAGRRGTARFWWPFAAVVLVFSGLAIAYSTHDDSDSAAPGAIKKRAPDAEPPAHGLEPAPAH